MPYALMYAGEDIEIWLSMATENVIDWVIVLSMLAKSQKYNKSPQFINIY